MTADRCAFLWYIKYAQRLKVNSRKQKLDTGSFTHTLLHDLYDSVMNQMSVEDWLRTRLNAVTYGIIDSLDFEDQIISASHAMMLVQRYCKSDILSGHTPVGSEQHFFVHVTTNTGRQFILQGYVDLITIDPKSRICIWDHKTAERMWSPLRIKMVIQLPVYQILLQADGINVNGVCINLLNTTQYKDLNAQPDEKLFRRDTTFWTPGQLQNVWSEFLALADDTLDLIDGIKTARRSIRDDSCYQCDFFSPCHANLCGEPLDGAVQVYSDHQVAFRGIPAGTSVELDMS